MYIITAAFIGRTHVSNAFKKGNFYDLEFNHNMETDKVDIRTHHGALAHTYNSLYEFFMNWVRISLIKE